MAFKMNKKKPGSLYNKKAGKNSTSFSMLERSSMTAAEKSSMPKPKDTSSIKAAEMSSMKDTDAENLKKQVAKNEALSDIISIPTIKKGTPQAERFIKNTPGTKYEFGGEYYDTKEDFEKAIAVSKGMSLAEYRNFKKNKNTTRKIGQQN